MNTSKQCVYLYYVLRQSVILLSVCFHGLSVFLCFIFLRDFMSAMSLAA